ncbi:Ubiquitin system component Cue protein [Abeliophyllum distichum]|uniref:Ubiquitin system component Cue protein n=1 Tax=Abeliophyllum distichum TaxID=126358 RepID=A0ABD1PPH6_9LAMI
MSAIVCGKRSNIFEETPSSPPVSKRIRCSSSSSPGRAFYPSSSVASSYSLSDKSSPLDYLVAVFPDMDKQSLEKALEVSGDDLDSAIKRLYELRLSTAASKAEVTQNVGALFSTQGIVANNDETASREELSAGPDFPVDGADWVELLIREMMSASNVEDGKVRVSRVLKALENSICARATAEASQSLQENVVLKQELEVLIQENVILKRAVGIQHERQKEFEESGQELHQLKQLVSQYQEQLRTLEVNNYTLAMHLKQAQQSNSIPGRFHPDVF